MKLCFVYNEKNDKYDKLVKNISKYLEEKGSNLKINNNIDKDSKVYKSKDDLYILLSDSAEELKQIYDDSKRPKKVLIITENLTVEYIMLCTDIVKNICYSKKEICDICSRIEATYEKYVDKQ